MGTNDSEPPGWPFNEQPPPIPPPTPPTSFEPPSLPAPRHAPPPPAAPYEPPYEPAQPATYPTPGPNAPGYESPGQPPPPPISNQVPPPPRKSRRKKMWTTIAIVLGGLALAIGSCTVWFISTVKAPVDESNKFLALVNGQNYAGAAALVSPTCSGGEITANTLANIFDGQPISYNLNSSSITNSDATVSGSFSSPQVSGQRIEVSLRNDDGWKVCGFRVSG